MSWFDAVLSFRSVRPSFSSSLIANIQQVARREGLWGETEGATREDDRFVVGVSLRPGRYPQPGTL